MKKLINQIDDVLVESLRGLGLAHPDIVEVSLDPRLVTRKTRGRPGKVALVSGGGSGHEPLHAGFVGLGMLDAACPGEVFTSPTPDQILAAAEAVENGGGILWIVKNYAGDVMNFEMAEELFEGEQATVITNDDVAVENSLHSQGRRGVAATVVVEKIVGAAAERGLDLQQCKKLGERVNEASGSMGIALSSCIVPAAGNPTFELSSDELEIGVGIHGEPGRRREKIRPADELIEELVEAIHSDIQPESGSEVLTVVNGMGGTPLLELYLVFDAVHRACESRGLSISRSLVGNYCTSLEMQGCSVTLTKLDEELKSLWDAPVHTCSLNWA